MIMKYEKLFFIRIKYFTLLFFFTPKNFYLLFYQTCSLIDHFYMSPTTMTIHFSYTLFVRHPKNIPLL